jgi:alanyl-tRNA synthetase
VPGRIEGLLDERRKLEKEVTELRRQIAIGGSGGSDPMDIIEISGIRFLGKILDRVPAKDLKSLTDDFKGQIGSGVVALMSVNEGRVSLVVGVTEDLVQKLSAVELVQAGSIAVGGKGGGGRPDMAQAGGPDGSKVREAITAIEKAISAASLI